MGRWSDLEARPRALLARQLGVVEAPSLPAARAVARVLPEAQVALRPARLPAMTPAAQLELARTGSLAAPAPAEDAEQGGWGGEEYSEVAVRAQVALAEALAEDKSVSVLDLRECHLLREGGIALGAALRRNTRLERVLLSGNDALEDAGAEAIAMALEANVTLRAIDLSECCAGIGTSAALGRALRMNDSLRELKVQIVDELGSSLAAVAAALQYNNGLESMFLVGTDRETLEGLAAGLRDNRTLTELCLFSAVVDGEPGAKFVAALRRDKALRTLRLASPLDNRFVSGLGAALRENMTLECVEVQGAQTVNAAAWAVLWQGLTINRTLTRLALQNCELPEAAAGAVGSALPANKGLRELDLRGNRFGQSSWWALFQGLLQNRSLRSLDLRDCQLQSRPVEVLASVLEARGSALEVLILNGNAGAGDKAWRRLGEALAKNQRVRCLHLVACGLGHEAAAALTKAVSVSPRLEELDISQNYGDAGAALIAVAIKRSRSLRKLVMADCMLGLESAHSLGRALAANSTLRELHLPDNPRLTSLGVAKIVASSGQNGRLRVLDLDRCGFGTEVCSALSQALSRGSLRAELRLGVVDGEPVQERALASALSRALARGSAGAGVSINLGARSLAGKALLLETVVDHPKVHLEMQVDPFLQLEPGPAPPTKLGTAAPGLGGSGRRKAVACLGPKDSCVVS